ncbi:MAG: cellulase family glycosylhydrolase [Polyangiaceae bacterium]
MSASRSNVVVPPLVALAVCVALGCSSGSGAGTSSGDGGGASGDAVADSPLGNEAGTGPHEGGTDASHGADSGSGSDGAGGGDGGSTKSDASPGDASTPGDAGTVARPGYNLGKGFFVLNGKLYDANGVEFRIRGINKLHWDNGSAGLAGSHANTVRWVIDFTQPAADNIALLQGGSGKTAGGIYDHMVVMPGAWDSTAGSVTCSNDPNTVAAAVATWVAQESSWTQLERWSIINIANEWGPSSSTVWRDSYISAIARMRAAGYHATLSITSGGCGQDNADLVTYAQAVFDSDPEKNVIFDRHVYGGDASVGALDTDAQALAALGQVVIFGEFGPGRNIGPSPTDLTPAQVIQTAEKYGFGWMSWAWDDNDLANAQADNAWFALSYTGDYTKSADLTLAGQAVVEGCTNPAPGGCGCPDAPAPADTVVEPGCKGTPAPATSNDSLAHLAVPATIF